MYQCGREPSRSIRSLAANSPVAMSAPLRDPRGLTARDLAADMDRVVRSHADLESAGLRNQRAQVGAAIGSRVEVRRGAKFQAADFRMNSASIES